MISAELENKLLSLVQKYPEAVLKVWAIEWEKHIHANFDNAGYGKWESKYIDDGRALLTGKTGLLKSGTSVEPDLANYAVTAGSSAVYAQVHQEGALIPVTTKMRKFFWMQFKETKNDKWKKLALMKKNYIEIPARPFITIDDKLIQVFMKSAEEILKIML